MHINDDMSALTELKADMNTDMPLETAAIFVYLYLKHGIGYVYVMVLAQSGIRTRNLPLIYLSST